MIAPLKLQQSTSVAYGRGRPMLFVARAQRLALARTVQLRPMIQAPLRQLHLTIQSLPRPLWIQPAHLILLSLQEVFSDDKTQPLLLLTVDHRPRAPPLRILSPLTLRPQPRLRQPTRLGQAQVESVMPRQVMGAQATVTGV